MTAARPNTQNGFTLAEAALALVVVSLVIGAVVPTLLSLRSSQQANVTRQNMETVMRSVSSFVFSTGCLPCPMPPEKVSGIGYGYVRGDDDGLPSCGTCNSAVGIVPFISLGIPESLAKDGYGRWLTYAVDTALTADFGYVPPTAACKQDVETCTETEKAKWGFCQEKLPSAARIEIEVGASTPKAAVLLLSHGANGRGAYKNFPEIGELRMAFPSSAPACADSGYEQCNADEDINFITFLASGGDNPFDDILLYFSRNALLSYLGNPSCETVW